MKIFLVKILKFLAPLLFLSVGMEYAIQAIPNEYQEKSSHLNNALPDIETLILGSSHALYGLNPESLTSTAFNLSHVSQSVDLDLQLLEMCVPKMPKLKRIVVTLSYFSLRETLATTTESWRISRYSQYYNIKSKKHRINDFDLVRLPFNYNITRIKEYYILGKNESWITPKGWSRRYSESNPEEFLSSSGKTAAITHTISKANHALIEKNKSDLNSIARWCNLYDIKLYLISTPTYQTYQDEMDLGQWTELKNQGISIQMKFPGTYYLNWMEAPDFFSEDFHDGDHLSARGAKKLTTRLQSFIDSVEN